MKKILVVTTLFIIIGGIAFAHGGRTDSKGCHIQKSTGKRHCH